MSKSIIVNRSSSADPIHHVKRKNVPLFPKTTVSPTLSCRREAPLPLSHPCLCDSADSNSLFSSTGDAYTLAIEHTDVCPEILPKVTLTPLFVSVSTILSIIQQLDQNECMRMDCILLDARENRHYQTSHLRHAASASCYTKTMAKRSIASWASNYARQQHPKDVYIYDQKTTSEQGVNNAHLQFFIDYLQQRGNRIYILDGGLSRLNAELPAEVVSDLFESSIENELVDRYTFSPTNAESASVDVLNATASEIESNIWLGNERDAHDWELLQRLGITHVLNVTSDVPNYFEQKRRLCYRRLRASDSHAQDLFQFFCEAHQFIEQAKNEGGRILVHCWAGVSRSATIVISYLMRSLGHSPTEALEFVRKRRSIVAPNFNFMGQLERYQEVCKRLHATPTTAVDDAMLWKCAAMKGSPSGSESDGSSGISVHTPLCLSLSSSVSEGSSNSFDSSLSLAEPMVIAPTGNVACKVPPTSRPISKKSSSMGRLRLIIPTPGSAPPPPPAPLAECEAAPVPMCDNTERAAVPFIF